MKILKNKPDTQAAIMLILNGIGWSLTRRTWETYKVHPIFAGL